jgi:hypothetical protein
LLTALDLQLKEDIEGTRKLGFLLPEEGVFEEARICFASM